MKNLRNQIVFIVAVLVVWQVVYQMGSFPELMFPSLGKIFQSLIKGFSRDGLGAMTLYSLSLIAKGLLIGIVLAFILSGLSIVSKTFYSIYHMVVSLCDLIPGVALLPLAILWMGIGEGTIILIVVHSIIWPMSRSIMDGFRAVPQIYIESGRSEEHTSELQCREEYFIEGTQPTQQAVHEVGTTIIDNGEAQELF